MLPSIVGGQFVSIVPLRRRHHLREELYDGQKDTFFHFDHNPNFIQEKIKHGTVKGVTKVDGQFHPHQLSVQDLFYAFEVDCVPLRR